MKLPPFLLDQWLDQKHTANPPIEYDLGSSTGPAWTLRELLALEGAGALEVLLDTKVLYTSPTGTTELREQIASLSGVDPMHVQVVTGGSEALLILLFAAAEPGANVVLPNPGFPANEAMAQGFGIKIRRYHLRAENQFRIDLDEVRAQVDSNTRLVLVNLPHNPTGAVMSEQEMECLHDFCAERGVQFVSDEVYHPIYHGPKAGSAARLPHATVLSDFSKALCLSGLRVGWLIDRDPERLKRYTSGHSYFTVTNSVLSESLAALALRHREAIYGRALKIASANLAVLDQIFAEHSGFLRWVRPQGGMTAFPWLADGGDARPFCQELAKRGVLIAPGDCFGMPSHFRVGFAASGENFPMAAERFSRFIREGKFAHA